MRPVIILLNGPRRSGKDTACEAMLLNGPAWFRVSLADQIRQETAEHYGITPTMADFYESIKDEAIEEFMGLTWRDLCISVGTKRREEDPAYWTKQWQAQAQVHFDIGADVVIMTDCRFQTELDAALAITPNVLLYRVYRTPSMHNEPDAWKGDIGSWLFPLVHDVPQISLLNDGHIDDVRFFARTTASRFARRVNAAPAL